MTQNKPKIKSIPKQIPTPSPIFAEFSRLESVMAENELTESNYGTMTKREHYSRSQRYSHSSLKFHRLKQINPAAFKDYEAAKARQKEAHDKDLQALFERKRQMEIQDLIRKKNAIIREKGLNFFGLDYDDYEREQIQREKEGKSWLALYEWVELKGFALPI